MNFCGCFKGNNAHVSGGKQPQPNPNRNSIRNTRAEDNLLEMNQRGAVGDESSDYATGNGDRSLSPNSHVTNNTFGNGSYNTTMSRFDDSKVSILSTSVGLLSHLLHS